MAEISILQKHNLSHRKARAAAQKVAEQIAEEYDMSLAWEGDVLSFHRSGVSGTLAVDPTEARLDISLGFLLSAFAAKIEHQVGKQMEKVFAGKA